MLCNKRTSSTTSFQSKNQILPSIQHEQRWQNVDYYRKLPLSISSRGRRPPTINHLSANPHPSDLKDCLANRIRINPVSPSIFSNKSPRSSKGTDTVLLPPIFTVKDMTYSQSFRSSIPLSRLEEESTISSEEDFDPNFFVFPQSRQKSKTNDSMIEDEDDSIINRCHSSILIYEPSDVEPTPAEKDSVSRRSYVIILPLVTEEILDDEFI